MRPSGTTRLAAVIGSPVRHSLSPLLHNTAFEALGLDWVYVALEVAEGGAPAALDAMRTLGIAGLSVTMPHKEAVADNCDALSADAAALGAVNCVVNEEGRLTGHNTDGDGFLAAAAAELGFDAAGARCVLLGAGGAARSIALSLSRAGATELAIVNRTLERAQRTVDLIGTCGSVVEPDGAAAAVASADLVVNATSVGMGGAEGAELPIDPSLLHADQVVIDIVYRPLRTPLLAAAQERGARTANGVSMLVHQAALAFTLWTGQPAPVDAMTVAVAGHLLG